MLRRSFHLTRLSSLSCRAPPLLVSMVGGSSSFPWNLASSSYRHFSSGSSCVCLAPSSSSSARPRNKDKKGEVQQQQENATAITETQQEQQQAVEVEAEEEEDFVGPIIAAPDTDRSDVSITAPRLEDLAECPWYVVTHDLDRNLVASAVDQKMGKVLLKTFGVFGVRMPVVVDNNGDTSSVSIFSVPDRVGWLETTTPLGLMTAVSDGTSSSHNNNNITKPKSPIIPSVTDKDISSVNNFVKNLVEEQRGHEEEQGEPNQEEQAKQQQQQQQQQKQKSRSRLERLQARMEAEQAKLNKQILKLAEEQQEMLQKEQRKEQRKEQLSEPQRIDFARLRADIAAIANERDGRTAAQKAEAARASAKAQSKSNSTGSDNATSSSSSSSSTATGAQHPLSDHRRYSFLTKHLGEHIVSAGWQSELSKRRQIAEAKREQREPVLNRYSMVSRSHYDSVAERDKSKNNGNSNTSKHGIDPRTAELAKAQVALWLVQDEILVEPGPAAGSLVLREKDTGLVLVRRRGQQQQQQQQAAAGGEATVGAPASKAAIKQMIKSKIRSTKKGGGVVIEEETLEPHEEIAVDAVIAKLESKQRAKEERLQAKLARKDERRRRLMGEQQQQPKQQHQELKQISTTAATTTIAKSSRVGKKKSTKSGEVNRVALDGGGAAAGAALVSTGRLTTLQSESDVDDDDDDDHDDADDDDSDNSDDDATDHVTNKKRRRRGHRGDHDDDADDNDDGDDSATPTEYEVPADADGGDYDDSVDPAIAAVFMEKR